jgi:hypothetical protein
MPNKNKAKGNSAERELCSIFGEIFNETFIRVPNSGAYAGGLNNFRAQYLSENQKQIMSNDIIPPTCFPNCALESKFYKDFEFHHLFRKEGNNTLNGWIDQVWDSGIDMIKAFPMICFKINRKGWFTCCWKDKIKDLDYTKLQHTVYHYKNNEYVIFELDTFLKTFTNELKKKFS